MHLKVATSNMIICKFMIKSNIQSTQGGWVSEIVTHLVNHYKPYGHDILFCPTLVGSSLSQLPNMGCPFQLAP